jgi:prepilin peptidase CpaA
MNNLIKGILIVLLIICFITDVKKNKIYNWVLVPFMIGGVAVHFVYGGVISGVSSIFGGLVPVVLFAPFFIMKMFGAGDIKLFSTIGFLMGVHFSLNNIIYSFIAAAGIVMVILIIRKKQARQTFESLRNVVLSQSMINYERGHGKFPFATAIFLGTVLQLIINYEFIYFK